jgi:hypothetical protein
MTPIATAHARVRALMEASTTTADVAAVVDGLVNDALCFEPETAADALFLVDLGAFSLLAARDDLEGPQQESADRALLALAGVAPLLARAAGQPLRDGGTLSDLLTFAATASSRLLRPAAA